MVCKNRAVSLWGRTGRPFGLCTENLKALLRSFALFGKYTMVVLPVSSSGDTLLFLYAGDTFSLASSGQSGVIQVSGQDYLLGWYF